MLPADIHSSFSILRQQAGLRIEQLPDVLGFSISTLYRWERGETKPRKAALATLEGIARSKHQHEVSASTFRFIDLFAGIGGLRKGFEPLGGKCVFTSEWDRYARETYMANYDCDHAVAGDITQIQADEIPEHDVLLAGFPCQPFSIAGVSKKNALKRPHGFRCESQGTLFFDVARVIAHHKPKAFLLENVKNLVNHDKGRTFDVIRHTLQEDLGYSVHTRVVDGRSWVPQHRERIYIVGFREENGFSFDDLIVPAPLSGPRLSTILHPEDGSEAAEKPFTEGSKAKVLAKYTLTDHLWNYLQAYAAKHKAQGNGFGFSAVGPNDVTRTLSARYYKDGSEILVKRKRGGNPRRLTPRECARLMGFDSPGGSEFNIPVSDTQAYKQFGNAVVVPAVKAVAELMAPWIGAGEFVHEDPRQRRLPLIA
ncbi:MAG: DNA (cytosine-5-)-methyltransferase [Alphaproteobacteria bacterium HGW-Alphaproteobacteria-12]|nr:MAG: DNA (cytosine-5-)-methyltransferase [Alphaproteobacteria bacterium HGW-Alphaproteobacteria-12]